MRHRGDTFMARWQVHFNHQIDTDDRELLSLLVQVEAYRLSIMKIPMPPAVQRELDSLNMIRQIKGTTGLEGNALTEAEIKKVIESGKAGREAEKEAANAHKVQLFIRQYHEQHGSSSLYISEDFIKKLHYINTEGLSNYHNVPGQYRQVNVHAGDYTPPDYTEIPALMKKFVEFINSGDVVHRLAPLIRAIIAHFYLITIHPFGDGNGRTSRALEAFILYSGGYNVRGFYSLANYHYRHRDQYILQLNKARFVDQGNLNDFVKYCIRAFLEELQSVQETILGYVKEIMFKNYLLEQLGRKAINNRMFSVVQFLLNGGELYVDEYRHKKHPFIAHLYESVTAKTAQRDLKRLLNAQLIVESDKKLRANVDFMNMYRV